MNLKKLRGKEMAGPRGRPNKPEIFKAEPRSVFLDCFYPHADLIFDAQTGIKGYRWYFKLFRKNIRETKNRAVSSSSTSLSFDFYCIMIAKFQNESLLYFESSNQKIKQKFRIYTWWQAQIQSWNKAWDQEIWNFDPDSR